MPDQPKKNILFVDDEPHSAAYFRDALTDRGYEVKYKSKADDGLKHLERHAAEVDLLILDMMMPTPQGVSVTETADGQLTGVWFLKQCRETVEDGHIPVLVLTNSKKVALEEYIKDQVTPLNWRLVVKTKTEVRAKDLPDLVDEILG